MTLMPGYNHFPWCMCGWCYKGQANGYSAKRVPGDFDRWSARRKLKEHGADRSWAACFVMPNASCPVCFAKVYYYQNQYGSRVFFDELGWPWPKHPCTENKKPITSRRYGTAAPLVMRKRGAVADLLEAAAAIKFDPNAAFRNKYGHSPFDLLVVVDVVRVGFKNFIKAESISPPLDDPVFLSFTSAKMIPSIENYFSFSGAEASFWNSETLTHKSYKAKEIAPDTFASARSGQHI